MNKDEINQEIERCKDPLYFYNTYITKNGVNRMRFIPPDFDIRIRKRDGSYTYMKQITNK